MNSKFLLVLVATVAVFSLLLCYVAAELEAEVVPIVLQLAKSEMSDDFRSEAAGVSIICSYLIFHLMFSKC